MRSGTDSKTMTNVFLLGAALLPWAFDVRSDDAAGSATLLQLGLLVTSLVFLVPLVAQPAKTTYPFTLKFFTLSLVGFVVPSTLISIYNGHPIFDAVAAAIPVVLLILTSLAAYAVTMKATSHRQLLWTIVAIVLLSAVFKVGANLAFQTGSGVVSSRYKILPGSNNLLVALPVVAIVSGSGIGWWILGGMGMLPTFLSATRTALLSLLAIVALTMISNFKLLARTSVAAIAGIALIGTAYVVAPKSIAGEMVDYWYFRLFEHNRELGFDLTAEVRRGELDFMIDKTFKSADTILFGNGMAAPTALSGISIRQFRGYIGDEVHLSSRGFGHNNYISLLFIGGALFGLPVIIAMMLILAQTIIAIYRLGRFSITDTVLLSVWMAAAYVSTTVNALLSSPMGDRSASVFFGLVVGTFLATDELRRRATQKRLPAPAAPVQGKGSLAHG